MNDDTRPEPAHDPDDLGRFFVSRANAGDIEGLVALYEPEALLAGPDDRRIAGAAAIRDFYARLLADRPRFAAGEQRPALRQGGLALTSTRLADGTVTAEIARRQPDGTWRWIIDQPAIAR